MSTEPYVPDDLNLLNRLSYFTKLGHTSQESFWIPLFPCLTPNSITNPVFDLWSVMWIWSLLSSSSATILGLVCLIHLLENLSRLSELYTCYHSGPAQQPEYSLKKCKSDHATHLLETLQALSFTLQIWCNLLRQLTWSCPIFCFSNSISSFHLLCSLCSGHMSHLTNLEGLQIYFFSGIFALALLFFWNAFLLDQMSFHLIIFDQVSPPQRWQLYLK